MFRSEDVSEMFRGPSSGSRHARGFQDALPQLWREHQHAVAGVAADAFRANRRCVVPCNHTVRFHRPKGPTESLTRDTGCSFRCGSSQSLSSRIDSGNWQRK